MEALPVFKPSLMRVRLALSNLGIYKVIRADLVKADGPCDFGPRR